MARRQVAALVEQDIELRIRQSARLAPVVGSQLLRVAELPLPRRVVHQRDQPDLGPLDQRRYFAARHAASNYRDLVALARAQDLRLASHDDTTLEHVAQSVADRVAIAEFPTTLEAALALHAAGIAVLMGAPNLVRGSSHSGNVGTAELARAGLLDVMSSDYMPSSLLMAAYHLPKAVPAIDLPAAVRTVTRTPAAAVGLDDRGEIVRGKRADLAQVRVTRDIPVVRSVWRTGARIA